MTTGGAKAALLASAVVGLVAMGMPSVMRLPKLLVFNPSDSAPRGWYRISRRDAFATPRIGEFVLARLPADAAALAAQRGYLPAGIPLLKRVAAVAPDLVCVSDQLVRINGAVEATALRRDAARRAMPVLSFCRCLRGPEVFLLSDTSAASFDGRYFGPIDTSNVIGIAHPLWIWRG